MFGIIAATRSPAPTPCASQRLLEARDERVQLAPAHASWRPCPRRGTRSPRRRRPARSRFSAKFSVASGKNRAPGMRVVDQKPLALLATDAGIVPYGRPECFTVLDGGLVEFAIAPRTQARSLVEQVAKPDHLAFCNAIHRGSPEWVVRIGHCAALIWVQRCHCSVNRYRKCCNRESLTLRSAATMGWRKPRPMGRTVLLASSRRPSQRSAWTPCAGPAL